MPSFFTQPKAKFRVTWSSSGAFTIQATSGFGSETPVIVWGYPGKDYSFRGEDYANAAEAIDDVCDYVNSTTGGAWADCAERVGDDELHVRIPPSVSYMTIAVQHGGSGMTIEPI